MEQHPNISELIEQNKLLIDMVCQLQAESIENKAILNRLLEKIGDVPKDTATSFKKMLIGSNETPSKKLSKNKEFEEQANKNQLDRHAKKMSKLGL